MDPRGHTALVTGAARRLGRVFAMALAEAGADIVLHFRHSEREAAQTAEEIRRLGVRVQTIRADLGRPDEVQSLFDRAAPDILVNSAAIFEEGGLADTTDEAWERHVAINLRAPFLLMRALARSGRPGVVVNISDWRASHPGRRHLAYTVAKAGLETLTRIAALELAPRVRVNALALGAVLPPATGGAMPPAPLPVEVSDAAGALLFLVRNDAVTGEVLFLDGGAHLRHG